MPYRPAPACVAAILLALAAGYAHGQDAGPAAEGREALTGPIAGIVVDAAAARTSWTAAEESAVVTRLDSMASIIDVTAHPITQGYIKGYVLRNREKSEAILGRVATYFPLFERELAAAGLPDDLKYLAVTESALTPTARSRSGAGGLWQFMPGTGAMYGLRITPDLDERADPEKATRAAVAFLRDEYERFGDWSLVLAAYNGGPGRVRRALRRSGKRDYWELRRYLPRETRNYVPAFVAAKYLYEHGASGHAMRPRALTLDEQFPEAITYEGGLPLTEVAQACDLSLDLLRAMNPHILRDTLAAVPRASIRVPARTAASLRSYLTWRDGGGSATPDELVALVRTREIRETGDLTGPDYAYAPIEHTFPVGRTLAEQARASGVSAHHLALWNPGLSLADTSASERQLLAYAPRFVPATPFSEIPDVHIPAVPAPAPRPLKVRGPVMPKSLEARLPNARCRLQRQESLLDVWRRYSESMTWAEFVAWNQIEVGSNPPAGTQLLVREE